MKQQKQSNWSILFKGILLENPVFVLILGTCPTLAMSKDVVSALGMGLAATAVLICSNVIISMLRNIIPDEVRIPCYIVVIAGFVTVAEMVIHAFLPDIYEALGVFLPLITVNCIILGRAEMFASKNTVGKSALDGIGMGLGFTLALIAMATIREIIGAGTFAKIPVPFFKDHVISVMVEAPGGLLTYGILIAVINKLTNGKIIKKKSFSCEGCPSAGICSKGCTQQNTVKEEG